MQVVPFLRPTFRLSFSHATYKRSCSTSYLPIDIKSLMARYLPKEVALEDISVVVGGWIRTFREQKKYSFIEIHDGTCTETLQIVCDASHLTGLILTTGACVLVQGTLHRPVGRKQGLEMHNPQISIYGGCDESFPIHKQGLEMAYLRQQLHLRSRTMLMSAIFRVRSQLQFAIHEFFQKEGFTNIHTPILTSMDCEGAGELFKVQSNGDSKAMEMYFGVPTFLTVSGQLHAEIFASSMSKVYTFGPTFRAEKSSTPRHLSEFWMVEPEMAFYNLNQTTQFAGKLLGHVIQYLFQHCEGEMQLFSTTFKQDLYQQLKPLTLGQTLPAISYSEAIAILAQKDMAITWGDDLQREHEHIICEHVQGPVFVTHWPKHIKPFYMKLDANDKRLVQNFDLLVPRVGELIGGSVREDDLSLLTERMKEKDLDMTTHEWYCDLRRYGSVPHAGFGLGFERLLQYVTGVGNIKDVVPIPRFYGECKF
eukprot:TRINITY_DN4548_c0_g1_i10.p1 TRINITY_DN4548_c0_g1~~TRINITY_DN4548_c0_g1_i10.p1  ORF type:complete len:479 (+),score=91.52 TRINITY_DN4548_c0_g1_i10:63-1499(+)